MKLINRNIISGIKVLAGNAWQENYAVVTEADKIKAIIPTTMIKHHLPAHHYEFSGHFLVPGFIDMHIHGIKGLDVMDAQAASFAGISEELAKEGVTSYLATTMTAAHDHIAQVLEIVPKMMQEKTGAKLLGVHLEGPFISPEKTGAHRRQFITMPDVAIYQSWQKRSQHQIKMITLAPELPGASALIKAALADDVLLSIGHTNATFTETQKGIAAGAKHATHLFNAMPTLHQREPGAVGALLLDPEVTFELIADGIHVHPAMIKLAWQLKPREVILVTDAIPAKCLADGEYEFAGQTIRVKNQVATVANGNLAGSVLSILKAINNMMQFVGCTFSEAIHLATQNPARILKLANKIGSIQVGLQADLVVLDAAGKVKLTLCDGRPVYVA